MQTYTPEYAEVALEGGLWGTYPNFSEALEVETGDVKFGRGVLYGTGEQQVVAPSGAATIANICGISVRSTIKERRYRETTDPYYSALDEDWPPILKQGFIWVFPTTVLTKRGAIFMQHTVNGNLEVGTFRVDADTANAVDVSSKVEVYRGNASIGEPALLFVNFLK